MCSLYSKVINNICDFEIKKKVIFFGFFSGKIKKDKKCPF
jgi:hypothetical protein